MTSSSKSNARVKLSGKNSVELEAFANRLVFQLRSFGRLTVGLATSRAHEFLSDPSERRSRLSEFFVPRQLNQTKNFLKSLALC